MLIGAVSNVIYNIGCVFLFSNYGLGKLTILISTVMTWKQLVTSLVSYIQNTLVLYAGPYPLDRFVIGQVQSVPEY